MFHEIKFINICPLCLGFVVLFLNYHLVVVFFWEEIIQSKIWVPIVWVTLCDEKIGRARAILVGRGKKCKILAKQAGTELGHAQPQLA